MLLNRKVTSVHQTQTSMTKNVFCHKKKNYAWHVWTSRDLRFKSLTLIKREREINIGSFYLKIIIKIKTAGMKIETLSHLFIARDSNLPSSNHGLDDSIELYS